MHEPVERLMAEAKRLGIEEKMTVLEEGEMMRLGARV